MRCWKCGAEIAEGCRFCNQCGTDQMMAPSPSDEPSRTAPESGSSSGGAYGGGSGGSSTGDGAYGGGYAGGGSTGDGAYGGGGGWNGGGSSGGGGNWNGGGAPGGTASNSGETVLKIFAAVCAVIYGIAAVRGIIGVIRMVFNIVVYYHSFSSLISAVVGLLAAVLNLVMCLALVMVILKRSPENSGGMIVLLGICGVGIIAAHLIQMLLALISNSFYNALSIFSQFFLSALGVVAAVAGVYLILRFLLGEEPLAGKSQDQLKQEVSAALGSLGKTAAEAAQGAKSSWDTAQQNRKNAQQAQWQAQQAQSQGYGQGGYGQGGYDQGGYNQGGYNQGGYNQGGYNQGGYNQGGYNQGGYNQGGYNQGGYNQGGYNQGGYNQGGYGQGSNPPPNGYPTHLKTDRSLLMYILLSIVTCGFYSWYFIHTIAQDVNTACAGDGKQTAGLAKYLLLGLITCGIYCVIWDYSLGNRLAENAPRFGLNFQENGTTVLLWAFLGSFLCGIGPFVAMNIIIKNTNTICNAYNYRNGV